MLLISISTMASNFQPIGAESETIIVPDDFFSIQEAINYAGQGDTVYVKAGIYLEHIIVDKNSLRLVGENRVTTIIDGCGAGSVVYVEANNTVFSSFTIQNSGRNLTDSGIYLDHSFNTSVSSNSVINNNLGIYLHESSNSILRNNNIAGNNYNFGVFSWNLQGYIHNIDISNIVDGKPIIYWVNQASKQPPANAGYVGIVNSTNITFENLTFRKNWQGMLFAYTTNSTIKNVTATNNMDGIWLLECSGCSLHGNNISDNNWGGIALVNSSRCSVHCNNANNNVEYGIFLSQSSDNMFYHNNFIDNRRQAWLYGVNSNTWDGSYKCGGNYWSDYVGVDEKIGSYQDETGNDGIGDTPYVIDSDNKDCYPLMKPWGLPPPEAPPINIVSYVIVGIGATLIIFSIIVYLMKIRKRPSEVSIQDPTSIKDGGHV
jgi:parallel beta-helix repeat protein